MEILIQPTIDNLREDLGYDENEDYNVDALLFQQGFDGYPIEVEDGVKFEIPEGYIGSIIDDGHVYYLRNEISEGVWENEEFYSYLESGLYILNDDVISSVEECDDALFNDQNDEELYTSDWNDEDDYDDGTDNKYDIVLNEISKSALKTIGLDNDDEQIINLMGAILVGISSEDNDDNIAGRAFAQLAKSGFMLPMEDIKEMCNKARENCKKQLFGLQIAFNCLREYECSAADALSQIEMFL